jgi:hypothetical protein
MTSWIQFFMFCIALMILSSFGVEEHPKTIIDRIILGGHLISMASLIFGGFFFMCLVIGGYFKGE